MKKPLIAVDIDDVLTHSAEAVIEFSNMRWNMNLTLDDFDEDWRKLWGLSPENEAEMHRRSQEFRAKRGLIDVRPRLDAERVLVKLQQRARIVAVTSRRRALEKATRLWLDTHVGGAVEEIHFAGIFDEDNEKLTTHEHRVVATKHDILTEVKPDYFIDDQPKHCEAALKLGIKTIIFGDYPWNRAADLEQKGATRCATWRDVETYFKNEKVL